MARRSSTHSWIRYLPVALSTLLAACGASESPEGAGAGKGAQGAGPARTGADEGTTKGIEVTMGNEKKPAAAPGSAADPKTGTTETATFGGGCFWCVEAVLEQLDGVLDVKSGYMGGHVFNPTYKQVCTGTTGHAEVVQVTFDPARISYEKLLESFWKLHDPTTPDRQGGDVGPQYRSVIFYYGDEQRDLAEKSKKALAASGAYRAPVVTEITKAGTFFEAEDYHQDYYRLNKEQPYCRAVIAPKLEKLHLEK